MEAYKGGGYTALFWRGTGGIIKAIAKPSIHYAVILRPRGCRPASGSLLPPPARRALPWGRLKRDSRGEAGLLLVILVRGYWQLEMQQRRWRLLHSHLVRQ